MFLFLQVSYNYLKCLKQTDQNKIFSFFWTAKCAVHQLLRDQGSWPCIWPRNSVFLISYFLSMMCKGLFTNFFTGLDTGTICYDVQESLCSYAHVLWIQIWCMEMEATSSTTAKYVINGKMKNNLQRMLV